MAAVARLITHVDAVGDGTDPCHQGYSARHEAVLTDDRRVLLLDDRGWSERLVTAFWGRAPDRAADVLAADPAPVSAEDIDRTARIVVGPDEPFGDRTPEDMASDHWAHLAAVLGAHGVAVTADELRTLPHDVVLSKRVRARLP